MTEAQAKRFYFPAWNRALKARWVRDRGTILRRADSPANELADQVESVAAARAARRQGMMTAEDLRHACHVVALGRDLSSKDLTNTQVDRVVALFELLQDRDNLSAQMRWDSPAADARRRLEWAVEHSGFPEAYVRHVASAKFSTAAWESLPDHQLRQLVMTLKNRARARNSNNRAAWGTETLSASGHVGRVGGAAHGAPGAAGAPARDEGVPGQEGEGDPF